MDPAAGNAALWQYLNSSERREPVIGLSMMTEYRWPDHHVRNCFCCHCCMDYLLSANYMCHLISASHRYNYIKMVYPHLVNDWPARAHPNGRPGVLRALAQEVEGEEGWGRLRVTEMKKPSTSQPQNATAKSPLKARGLFTFKFKTTAVDLKTQEDHERNIISKSVAELTELSKSTGLATSSATPTMFKSTATISKPTMPTTASKPSATPAQEALWEILEAPFEAGADSKASGKAATISSATYAISNVTGAKSHLTETTCCATPTISRTTANSKPTAHMPVLTPPMFKSTTISECATSTTTLKTSTTVCHSAILMPKAATISSATSAISNSTGAKSYLTQTTSNATKIISTISECTTSSTTSKTSTTVCHSAILMPKPTATFPNTAPFSSKSIATISKSTGAAASKATSTPGEASATVCHAVTLLPKPTTTLSNTTPDISKPSSSTTTSKQGATSNFSEALWEDLWAGFEAALEAPCSAGKAVTTQTVTGSCDTVASPQNNVASNGTETPWKMSTKHKETSVTATKTHTTSTICQTTKAGSMTCRVQTAGDDATQKRCKPFILPSPATAMSPASAHESSPAQMSESTRRVDSKTTGPAVGLNFLVRVMYDKRLAIYCQLCEVKVDRKDHRFGFRHRSKYVRFKRPDILPSDLSAMSETELQTMVTDLVKKETIKSKTQMVTMNSEREYEELTKAQVPEALAKIKAILRQQRESQDSPSHHPDGNKPDPLATDSQSSLKHTLPPDTQLNSPLKQAQPVASRDPRLQPGVSRDPRLQPGALRNAGTQPVAYLVSRPQPVAPWDTMTQPMAPGNARTHPVAPPDATTQQVAPLNSRTQAMAPPDRRTESGAPLHPNIQPGARLHPKTLPVVPQNNRTEPVATLDSRTQPEAPLDPKLQPGAPLHFKTQPGAPLLPKQQPGAPEYPRPQPGAPLDPKLQPGAPLHFKTQPGAPLLPKTQLAQPGVPLHFKTQPGPPLHHNTQPVQPGAPLDPKTQSGAPLHSKTQAPLDLITQPVTPQDATTKAVSPPDRSTPPAAPPEASKPQPEFLLYAKQQPGAPLQPNTQPVQPGAPLGSKLRPGAPLHPNTQPGPPLDPKPLPGAPLHPKTKLAHPGAPPQPGAPMHPSTQPVQPGAPLNPKTQPGAPLNPKTQPGAPPHPETQPAQPGPPLDPKTQSGAPLHSKTQPGAPLHPKIQAPLDLRTQPVTPQDATSKAVSPPDRSTPPADRSTPPADRSTPPADRSTPPVDRSTPPADRSTPPADRSTPPADRSTPPADRSTPPAAPPEANKPPVVPQHSVTEQGGPQDSREWRHSPEDPGTKQKVPQDPGTKQQAPLDSDTPAMAPQCSGTSQKAAQHPGIQPQNPEQREGRRIKPEQTEKPLDYRWTFLDLQPVVHQSSSAGLSSVLECLCGENTTDTERLFPFYMCRSCQETVQLKHICGHIISTDHQLKYMSKNPDLLAVWNERMEVIKAAMDRVTQREQDPLYGMDAEVIMLDKNSYHRVQAVPFSEGIHILEDILKQKNVTASCPPADQQPPDQQSSQDPPHTEESSRPKETDKSRDKEVTDNKGRIRLKKSLIDTSRFKSATVKTEPLPEPLTTLDSKLRVTIKQDIKKEVKREDHSSFSGHTDMKKAVKHCLDNTSWIGDGEKFKRRGIEMKKAVKHGLDDASSNGDGEPAKRRRTSKSPHVARVTCDDGRSGPRLSVSSAAVQCPSPPKQEARQRPTVLKQGPGVKVETSDCPTSQNLAARGKGKVETSDCHTSQNLVARGKGKVETIQCRTSQTQVTRAKVEATSAPATLASQAPHCEPSQMHPRPKLQLVLNSLKKLAHSSHSTPESSPTQPAPAATADKSTTPWLIDNILAKRESQPVPRSAPSGAKRASPPLKMTSVIAAVPLSLRANKDRPTGEAITSVVKGKKLRAILPKQSGKNVSPSQASPYKAIAVDAMTSTSIQTSIGLVKPRRQTDSESRMPISKPDQSVDALNWKRSSQKPADDDGNRQLTPESRADCVAGDERFLEGHCKAAEPASRASNPQLGCGLGIGVGETSAAPAAGINPNAAQALEASYYNTMASLNMGVGPYMGGFVTVVNPNPAGQQFAGPDYSINQPSVSMAPSDSLPAAGYYGNPVYPYGQVDQNPYFTHGYPYGAGTQSYYVALGYPYGAGAPNSYFTHAAYPFGTAGPVGFPGVFMQAPPPQQGAGQDVASGGTCNATSPPAEAWPDMQRQQQPQ